MRIVLVLLLLVASCKNLGSPLIDSADHGNEAGAPDVRKLEPLRAGRYTLRDDLPHFVSTLPGVQVFPDTPEQECANVKPRSQRCRATKLADGRVELRLEGFDAVRAEQERPQWCWAACVQMVHAYQGVKLTPPATEPQASQQALLVSHFTRAGGDPGGTLSVILRALNPDFEERLRLLGPSAALAFEIPSSDDLVESLLDGLPAIVGLQFDGQDHALVVRALTLRSLPEPGTAEKLAREAIRGSFLAGLHERYRIRSIELQDPARTDSVRTLDGEELKMRCKLIVTPERSRRVLQLALESKPKQRNRSTLDTQGAVVSLPQMLGALR